MARKGIGIGRYQKDLAWDSEKQILNVLSDGKWHRYQEIQQAARLSSRTLSKHLKRLEKGLVEKHIDLQSGEYPYPVYYRIKESIYSRMDTQWRAFLFEQITKQPEFWLKQPETFIEFLNQMVGLQILINLHYYFTWEKNEAMLQQSNEFLAFSLYQECVDYLKAKLEELGKTENLSVILAEAEERMAKDFEIMWKAKFKNKPTFSEAFRSLFQLRKTGKPKP
jgi:DNA-binding transcriptional ArsR family regulator